MISRRTLLSSTVPAIGTLALVAPEAPARAEAALDRARRAWREFCSAMTEVAGDADGWIITGAGERWVKLHPSCAGGPWLNLRTINYKFERHPALVKPFKIERHREVAI